VTLRAIASRGGCRKIRTERESGPGGVSRKRDRRAADPPCQAVATIQWL
jgi:hypothetical protein